MMIGNTPVQIQEALTKGGFVYWEGEHYYKIRHYDEMPPFLMSIVSSTDHWIFVNSNGALTAGRRNPDAALFPYYTDDKLQDSPENTGSKTILRVQRDGNIYAWEPFSENYAGMYAVTRNLYKTIYGDKLVFEEVNHDLELTFRYGWMSSDTFGLVRKSWLVNHADAPVTFEILDGIQNILPFGVSQTMQNRVSTLVDAYKKNELDLETGLGMFMLSSIIVDRAEPSEALKCHTVWSAGLQVDAHLLSSRQLNDFHHGKGVREEVDVRAERGAYFLHSSQGLAAGGEITWYLVAEVNQGPSEVATLRRQLTDKDRLVADLEADITAGSVHLGAMVASSDGMQWSVDQPMAVRHFSNVLFNIMRGGVFFDNYQITHHDFQGFLKDFNRPLAEAQADFLAALPEQFSYADLLQQASATGDVQLQRLCYEYLPLTFSRRHGDPSRPWNKFSIEIRDDEGNDKLYYAGNWRDIFQNWEALAYSFPAFIEGMISKFVNASTPDGYNPYRITRDGIDWETIEPDDPWSYIGYWGDHQIIYLQKLLEASHRHHPGRLEEFLVQPLFSYANVPYRIKPYEDLLVDPTDTVVFDDDLAELSEERVADIGADGKMLQDAQGQVYQVNLTEKLLVSILAKLSNYIPEGGIWLNTQRPEWNDANNALVGNGVSMVTLYYLRRMLAYLHDFFGQTDRAAYPVSTEVAELFGAIHGTLQSSLGLLQGKISDQDRKKVLDELGQAGSVYRQTVYAHGFTNGQRPVQKAALLDFFTTALQHIDHSIRANKREDDLYHAYNLMTVEADGTEVALHNLYEMLEGQVAVLSSGLLSAQESLAVLRALRQSKLYRADQHSYLLYPDRKLPRFLEKNNIPAEKAEALPLFSKLVADGDRHLVERDEMGLYHFNGEIRNGQDVQDILDMLKDTDYGTLAEQDEQKVLDLFEELFDHKSFTGRSGTFFAYEGLGSIYWHMCSKLLLAVQETCWWSMASDTPQVVLDQLIEAYYDVRAGIGFNKTPDNYGAFPMDPYSHTPAHAGAQQPGMTGQVKEDILARFGELGVVVEHGEIHFRPEMLRAIEFSGQSEVFTYYDLASERHEMTIPEGSLAFTYCQVPVIYHRSDDPKVVVTFQDGTTHEQDNLSLTATDSAAIFGRTQQVKMLEVWLKPGH
jgi:hypothetical protein